MDSLALNCVACDVYTHYDLTLRCYVKAFDWILLMRSSYCDTLPM